MTADREEANDLLQETSLKALDNEEKFTPDTNFKGWMYTIMRNIFINNYRKTVRDQTFVDQTDNLFHLNLPQDSGFDSTEGAYDLKEIHRIVNALPKDYYDKDADLKKAVDFLVSDEMMKVGSKENLERLYNELLNKDWFMTFPDFEDYCKTKEKAYADYEDKKAWAKKMLVNISKAGFFSSDRTIKQYNDEIWHLEA